MILAGIFAGVAAALALVQSAAAQGPHDQGWSLAVRLCASCHAIGAADRSPNPAAPPFRRFEPRVDLDQLAERLREGLIAGHPEMPVFVLRGHEARAMVAYIRSLQDGGGN